MKDKPINILLIEDNAPDANLVRNMLNTAMEEGFTLKRAPRLSEGLEQLAEGDFDVVLLDLSLPDSRMLETFEAMHTRAPWIPIVVLSGSGNKSVAIQAMQRGAQDYLVKGEVDGDMLARSLRYAIERKRSAEALRKERDLVARLMETSPVSITVANQDGEIIFANARAEEMLGIVANEITGLGYNAPQWHITGLDGEPFPDEALPFQRVMRTKGPVYNVRHAIEGPDGRRRFLSINGAPIFDECATERRVEKVVFAIEDITEQVQAERARIAQLKREIETLSRLTTQPNTLISARSYGAVPLRENIPDLFPQFVEAYGELLECALEKRTYKVKSDLKGDVRALAERLGALKAGPRDVVDIHISALKEKSDQATPLKGTAYAEEGRLIALELMGHLVSYYRNRCVIIGHSKAPHHSSRGGSHE
ncbi:MAG: response regulator [Anaerolineae bacterium]